VHSKQSRRLFPSLIQHVRPPPLPDPAFANAVPSSRPSQSFRQRAPLCQRFASLTILSSVEDVDNLVLTAVKSKYSDVRGGGSAQITILELKDGEGA
jgi:hypothetical protein